MKKKRKKQCPCQFYPKKGKDTMSKGCQCCMCKGKKGKHKCDCHGKKKNICECPPPEPEPEIIPIKAPDIEIDYEMMQLLKEEFKNIDKAEMMEEMKMKSDMTQTTSGFRFKFKKRPPSPKRYLPDEDMSFEDAVQYFNEHPEAAIFEEKPEDELPIEDACKCDGPIPSFPPPQPKNTKNTCECPEDETANVGDNESAAKTAGAEEPQLKGFKIVIEGKGSGSKGLAGVCCFDKCIK